MCVTLMGAIDCLIFCLRERPWRHIPKSDGTFLGSFQFWRTFTPQRGSAVSRPGALQRSFTEANPETPHTVQESWSRTVIRTGRNVGGARTIGTSSDYARGRAEMARVRLQMEKEERRENIEEGDGVGMGIGMGMGPASRRRRSTMMTVLETSEIPEEEREKVELGAQEEGSGAGSSKYREDDSAGV